MANLTKKLISEIYGIGEETIKVVSNDGSPAGEKHWLVWNSPYVSPEIPESGRIHPIGEASRLLIELTMRGVRTIAFCRVRRTCELLMKAVRTQLQERDLSDPPNIMSYRGGYSATDRRLIELEMFSGKLSGIVATNALELGIDIGALDAVLMVGFPFSIAALRQQSGRAGRRSQASLCILIGGGDPIDQHYMANPGLILTEPNLNGQEVMLDNSVIMENHLQCAAHELPINILNDERFFGTGGRAAQFREMVTSTLELISDDPNELEDEYYYTCASKYLPNPSSTFSLRGLGTANEDEDFSVIDITSGRNTVIEQVEVSRVAVTLYEGGVFMHQGCTYLIKSVDPKARYATVEKKELNWITKQRDFTDVDPARTERVTLLSEQPTVFKDSDNAIGVNLQARYGKVSVQTIVFGFYKLTSSSLNDKGKKSKGFFKIIDAVEIPGPQQRPLQFDANGLWINLPTELIDLVQTTKHLSIAAGIHAAQHILMAVMPYYSSTPATADNSPPPTMPDADAPTSVYNYWRSGNGMSDLGTECKAPEKEFKKTASLRKRPARLIFYENRNSGSAAAGDANAAGIASKAFANIKSVLGKALYLVSNCPVSCTIGCPACGVAMPGCTENNVVLSKPAAILILRYLVVMGKPGCSLEDLDLNSIPEGPEENLANMKMADTIIACT